MMRVEAQQAPTTEGKGRFYRNIFLEVSPRAKEVSTYISNTNYNTK